MEKMKADYFTESEAKLAKETYLANNPELSATIKQAAPGSDYFRIWIYKNDLEFGTIYRSQAGLEESK